MKPLRDVLEGPFAAWLGDDDWRAWHAFLMALRGEPMTREERRIFRDCTGRSEPPTKPFTEAWAVVGRKGRKSAVAALVACYFAVYGRWKRAPGETLRIVVVALSKDQARLVTDYCTAILESRPGLARLIESRDAGSITLTNGIQIACFPNSFRLVRGPSVCLAILDEVAFWWNHELAANPDTEVLRAIKPSMVTVPGSLVLGLSSPYAARGLLYEKHRDHHARDDSCVLVWQADTATMNPQVDAETIAEAYRDDPEAAAAEYGARFRDDLSTFVSPDVVRALAEPGLVERPPEPGREYVAFVDPAGGSGTDSMTLAISHAEGQRAVLDALRERRPRFAPSEVVDEFAALLRSYRVRDVVGDRFGGEWCREPFRARGITYRLADRDKSAIYRDSLPILNSGAAALLDDEGMIGQLCALQRSTARSRGDRIDHPRGAHDDLCNAACGALVEAVARAGRRRHLVGTVGVRVIGPGEPGRRFGEPRPEVFRIGAVGPSEELPPRPWLAGEAETADQSKEKCE